MRKKMCQNDSFYEHYSYRTDVKQIGKVSNVVTEILKINRVRNGWFQWLILKIVTFFIHQLCLYCELQI